MRTNSGSTLATVIILMLIVSIMVLLFLSLQTSTLRGFSNRKEQLQAIAETRSRVIKALAKLPSMGISDTSAINTPLFEDSSSTKDTASLECTPFSVKITARKKAPMTTLITEAETGSSLTPKDTTVILCSVSTLEAPRLSGIKVIVESDTAKGSLPLNRTGATKAKKWITDIADKLLPSEKNPEVINSPGGFSSIRDTVKGPLFFHGGSAGLKIDGQGRTIVVNGDVQFTGKVTLRNLVLIVDGEVRINDKTSIKGVDLAVVRRVFIGDDASFSGRIAALEQIEILGNAKITHESLVLSFAEKKEAPVDGKPVQNAAIAIRERATVSGTVVALGKDGILTQADTKTTGILWSNSWIRHEGTHKGLVRAVSFVSDIVVPQTDSAGATPTVQHIAGKVEPSFSKVTYPLPWYIGKPSLISWREWNGK